MSTRTESAGSHPLTLDRTGNSAVNLMTVQRIDPSCTAILATANHVAVYEFSEADKTWVRRRVTRAPRRGTFPPFLAPVV